MTDSIETLGSPRVNRLHGGIIGRIHKGHSTVAHSATIPTKYHTVVIENGDRKGFASGSRRFQYEAAESGNPSCMDYDVRKGFLNDGPSLSMKGMGGFASKQKRNWKLESGCGAEPNIYKLPTGLISRKDFNSSSTANFHQNIAVHREKPSDSPASNKYNLSSVGSLRGMGKENKVAAASSFNSRTRREFMDLTETKQKPGPGRYHPERADVIIRTGDMAPVSSFKSTTKRRIAQPPPAYPGPAAYNPSDPVEENMKKMLFPKKHYLCLSAPALPLPPTPPGPGPGQYEMSAKERPRHFMSGSVFLSNTSRWAGGGAGSDDSAGSLLGRTTFPGPSHYHPTQLGKQSFLYNATGKWM